MRLIALHVVPSAFVVLVFAVQSHAQQPRDVPRVAVGPWRVTSSVIAPWAIADAARLDRAVYLRSVVQLRAASFSGLGPFACARPRYEQTAMPPEGVAIDNVIWTLDRSPGALAAATTPAGVVQRLLEAHFAFDTIQYQLRSGPAWWRVDNIIYPRGGTFTGLLRMKAD